MKRVLLLWATTFCLCAFAPGDTQDVQQEEKSLPKKNFVLQMTKENFNRSLREHKQLLVYFYAPFSHKAHRVLAAFEGAAEELQESEVRFAVIDVTKEKDLAKDLNATSAPAIRLYLVGDKQNPTHCPVPQSSASIITWLKRRVGSVTDIITDLSLLEASEELTVVGFFKELQHEYVQVFYSAAIELPDVNFAVTQNAEVISKYGLAHNVVLLLKKSKLIQAHTMMPQTSKEELIIFITVYQMDPVTEYTGETEPQILSSPVFNHALLFIKKSSVDFEEIHFAFNRVALEFRLKILFVLVNVDESRNGRLMEYFQVKDVEAPLIRLVNMTDHVNYQLPSDKLDKETIKKFCQSYLDGKAKPKMQSEPVPEGWDKKPVKELVGMTLNEVALNPNKTVFVLFYLPYSQESRSLFPLWEKLAEALKEQEDVVIARIDASANDIYMWMRKPYPSLCLFLALHSERMVEYTGKRELKDLLTFIEEEMEKAKKERAKEDEEIMKFMAFKDEMTKDEL